MNFEPAASNVEIKYRGHVDHSGVVDVKLSDSQNPRQFHPLHEYRRRDVAECDGDTDSELDGGSRSCRSLDGQVDGRLGAAVSDHRHVGGHRLNARQATRQQVLDVCRIADEITIRSTDNGDDDLRDIRPAVFTVPHVAVMCSVGELCYSKDSEPRLSFSSWPVVIERGVHHHFVVAAVLNLPPAVSPYRLRQRSLYIRAWAWASVTWQSASG